MTRVLSRLRLCLVCLLLGTTLLVYVNAPEDADGTAMLAVAVSMAAHGRLDMDAVGASDWLLLPRGKMGAFGIDGALYAKKGITPSLVMLPLVEAAIRFPWLSVRATAALLNALVTTATGLLLFEFSRWPGFRVRTALATALIYGLATFAIAYVKTAFGEPLVALLLLLAVMATYRYRQAQRAGWLLVAGSALALNIGVNPVYFAYVPLVGVYALTSPAMAVPRSAIRAIRDTLWLVAPILIMLGVIGAYNAARFGNPLTSGYQFDAGEGFTYPLLDGLYGLILSPYRGVFWYNPALLMAIPGWFLLVRRARGLAWLVVGLIAAQALLFASWWSWYGGIVWGPRFLLPILPLAMICIAPMVEAAWTRRWLFVATGTLVGLSALIQVIGVLFSYLPYTGYLIAAFGEPIPRAVIADPLLSPIVGHLALLLNGHRSDLAWLANGIDVLRLAISSGLLALAVAVLRVRLPRPGWMVTAAIVVALNIVAARQTTDPDVAKVAALDRVLQPPGIVVAATQLFGDQLVDIKGGSRVISMNAPTAPDDARARQVWGYALAQGRRLWLVTWFGSAAPENWQERDLWQRYSFVKETSAAGHRALLFDLGAVPPTTATGGWSFGDSLRLERYGVRRVADGVYVTLVWKRRAAMTDNASWFVHLLDPSGQIAAQQDRQPLGGYRPTTSWEPGEEVMDRLFLPMPAGAAIDGWWLRVGWIDPVTGQPMPATTPDGSPLTEPFVLIEVN